jgi:multidrug efflux pump subunit AcrA (membrane-fusion protein)
LALAGVSLGLYTVSTAYAPQAEVALSRPPSTNPFPSGVACLGVVESAGREVEVASPEPGLIVEVLAEVGDRVTRGQPLLRLDTRVLDADLLRAEAALAPFERQLDRWRALPRPEDVPPARAEVERASAVIADREDRVRRNEEAIRAGVGAVTPRELSESEAALASARAELLRAQAELARLMAGGWGPDRDLIEAELARARSEVASLRLLRERLTVTAPRDGTILSRDIEPGEQASAAPDRPLMILADLDRLRVRAQIDEEDIGLVARSIAEGRGVTARTRGALVRELRLTPLRIEPIARPKRQITGAGAERVDTRVIDVLFDVASPAPEALFPGQAVDVFIEVGPER